ncbi:CPBP family intramembrane glutamic endopeptidase [Agromyces italicus]|uniref:CPBP family intramembrane glutamic endopeptidase n=1 Tax=Agromyces italicus TaxID=279572 RepID=UPI0003B714B4|nr:CPBP family intramembrane glutamic endopeptidase [Agromyces italicus]
MTNETSCARRRIRPLTDRDRFGTAIERRDGADFPFYDGVPIELTIWRWLVVWAACIAGFLVLTFFPQPGNVVAIVPRTLFVAIPLAVLALVAGRHWTALFRRVGWRELLAMVFFAVLNIVVTVTVGAIVSMLFRVSPNTTIAAAGDAGGVDTIALFVGSGIQLVGEEVFTLLPFLAVLYLLFAKGGLSRKTAVVLAWVASALWFGAAHLPTYDWNAAQAFLVIGSARIAFTLAFIRTKNLWVAAGAHILNDWVFLTVAVAGLAGGAALT